MVLLLTGGVAILLTAGLKTPPARDGKPTLQVGSSVSEDKPSNRVITRDWEINGEVYFPYDLPDPGNHARVGAIVDGLRRIAILQTFGKTEGAFADTVICRVGWGNLLLDCRSIYSKGILLSDEVSLTLEDTSAVNSLWRLNNLRLVEPAADEDVGLDALINTLGSLGFVLVKGRRIGRDIWQETIRWTNAGE